MPMKTLNLAAVGDVMIDREDPKSSFSLVRDVIQKAEISANSSIALLPPAV